jgi:hypothetical protein
MKLTIDERKFDSEVLFFLEPETVEEAAQLLRIANNMVGDNEGYAGYHEKLEGWVRLPMSRKEKTIVNSGKKR